VAVLANIRFFIVLPLTLKTRSTMVIMYGLVYTNLVYMPASVAFNDVIM